MNRHQEDFDAYFIKLSSNALKIPETRVLSLLKRRVLQDVSVFFPGHYRFDKGISGIEPGTALFRLGDRIEVIKGYPKIKRAMILDPTLNIHFKGVPAVVIEEKMNGYNVRITRISDRVIALTRGGLICPYTTEKADEQINPDFFNDHPDLVLCGEMVGPDNPYVPKSIYPEVKSICFYIFDIRRKESGKPLSINDKHELCSRYNINTVRDLGKYPLQTAADAVTGIIKELGEKEHEGVVIKDPWMRRPPLKYTSSQSTNNDLKYAFQFYNDYGKDFFFSRVIREAFQSVEWDEDETSLRKRCQRLGESIIEPMVGTIRKKKQGERITEDVRIRVKHLDTARQFQLHLMRMGIDALFEEPQPVDGEYLIVIKKFIQSTNDRTAALLSGQLW